MNMTNSGLFNIAWKLRWALGVSHPCAPVVISMWGAYCMMLLQLSLRNIGGELRLLLLRAVFVVPYQNILAFPGHCITESSVRHGQSVPSDWTRHLLNTALIYPTTHWSQYQLSKGPSAVLKLHCWIWLTLLSAWSSAWTLSPQPKHSTSPTPPTTPTVPTPHPQNYRAEWYSNVIPHSPSTRLIPWRWLGSIGYPHPEHSTNHMSIAPFPVPPTQVQTWNWTSAHFDSIEFWNVGQNLR